MKKFLALILALVMSLSLVACGSEETTDEGATDGDTAASELNVGVFYYNYSDAYITTVRNAMDGLLEEAGITYNNYDGAGNQATQLDQINTAISNGANLLVVNPTLPSRPAMPPRTPASPSSSSTARLKTAWSTAMRTAPSSAPTPPRPATCRAR